MSEVNKNAVVVNTPDGKSRRFDGIDRVWEEDGRLHIVEAVEREYGTDWRVVVSFPLDGVSYEVQWAK